MKALTSRTRTKPIKTCSCGRSFTRAEWNALPLVGRTAAEIEARELRNCTGCNSTLSIDLATEMDVAGVIASFLGAKDRIASDLGLLKFALAGNLLLVEHAGAVFAVTIHIERRQ